MRSFTPAFFLRSSTAAILVAGLFLTAVHPIGAAGGKQLQRVRGTVGYETATSGTDFKAVFGKFELPDNYFAVTRTQSAAVVAMPDSSLISLGENTTVQVGAFDTAATGPGSTITIAGGALRFDIRRPQGGASNYRFQTSTSQIAVRGTVGLLSFANGETTVGCLVCASDSVTVTAGGQTVTLATGQFVTVSATGAITTGAIGSVVGSFTSAGVPVSTESTAVAAGLPGAGAAGAGAAAGVTTTAIITGAAVAGTAIGIAASSHSSPSPQPSATPTTQPTAGQPGNVNLTGHAVQPGVRSGR